MKITDEAKAFLQEVMEENNAKNIRIFVAGIG